MSIALTSFGSKPTGIDLDSTSIMMAKTRLPKEDFVVSEGYDIKFPDNQFDAVTLLHVIEHVPKPKLLLSEVFRILKPGGVLLMECPNRLYPFEPHQQIPIITIFPKSIANIILGLIIHTPLVSKDLKQRCIAVKTSLPNFVSYFTLKKLAKTLGFVILGSNELYEIGLREPSDKTVSYDKHDAIGIPITGDWDDDRKDSMGFFDDTNNTFNLFNQNNILKKITLSIQHTNAIPISGDWDGDGKDSIGVYVKETGTFFLKNSNESGNADIIFPFGPTNAIPISGDWDGDGKDSIGVYVKETGTFFLKNSNESGNADIIFPFGPTNAIPISGDWDGDGKDSIGVYVKETGTFFLKNSNESGNADLYLNKKYAKDAIPVTGDWDGDGKTTTGLFDPIVFSFTMFGTNYPTNSVMQTRMPKKSLWRNISSKNTLLVCKKK